MTGVAFSTRLQMYPKADQLLIILMLLVEMPILQLDGGIAAGGFTAFFSGIALWVAVPSISRYRAFGIPTRLWIIDTLVAVHVVVLLFLGLWTSTGAGPWGLVGILIADLAVLLRLSVTVWPVVRGDDMAGRGGFRRPAPSFQLPRVPGPLPLRLGYFPVSVLALSASVVILLLTWFTSIFFEDITVIGPAFAVTAMTVPIALNVLSSGYRGWTTVGAPASRWLTHAHVCAVLLVAVIAVTWVLTTTFTGLDSGWHETSAPGNRAVLVAAMLLLLAALIVRGSMAGNGGVVGLVFMPLFGFSWLVRPELAESPRQVLLVVSGLLVLTVVTLRSSCRKARKGDVLHRPGPFIGRDGIYYQRQGAL